MSTTKRRPHEVLPIRERVQDLVRPVLRHVGRELGEAGEEAGVAHELRGDAVVGMTSLERRRDHDARPEAADRPHEQLTRRRRVLDPRVGQPERLARAAADDLGGTLRFLPPQLGRAARAHLALREVDDRRALPRLGRLDERAAAGELDVVAMRGDGEEVDRRRCDAAGIYESDASMRASVVDGSPPRRVIRAATVTVDRTRRAPRYSYRSATTGSSRAALIAGSIPNRMPVTALMPSAAATVLHDVVAGTTATPSARRWRARCRARDPPRRRCR